MFAVKLYKHSGDEEGKFAKTKNGEIKLFSTEQEAEEATYRRWDSYDAHEVVDMDEQEAPAKK